MASPAHTTRRSLFAIAGGAALLPAAAAAGATSASAWEALIAALSVINPDLSSRARDARMAGYEPDELTMVVNYNDGRPPFLLFRREYGPVQDAQSFPKHGLGEGLN